MGLERVFILGARGRLGRAIARQAGNDVQTLERSEYADWHNAAAMPAIKDRFASQRGTVFVTCGLLDPRLPQDALDAVNYSLPRNVLLALQDTAMRVVTFGTAMEAIESFHNPYVASKRRLSQAVQDQARTGAAAQHIRVHTLYGGGAPHPFMFLGQICDHLQRGALFKMSHGRQMREYHHVDDVAAAMQCLPEVDETIINLSHGAPLTLRGIATSIFDAFGCPKSLQVGALPAPESENYGGLSQNAAWLPRRDPLPAIIADMRIHVQNEVALQ